MNPNVRRHAVDTPNTPRHVKGARTRKTLGQILVAVDGHVYHLLVHAELDALRQRKRDGQPRLDVLLWCECR